MKKVAAILLLCIYGSTSVGVTVQLHYCMDELVDWTIGHHAAKNKLCGRCGMEEKDGDCCKNDYALFKINIDQNKTFLSTQDFSFSKDLCENKVLIQELNEGSTIDSDYSIYIDPPPFLTDRRLHLLYCVFLI